MNSTTADDWRDRDVLDFHAVILRLLSAKWWIIASSLVMGVIALVIGFCTTPVFRATAVLIAASSERTNLGNSLGSLSGLAALAGANLGGANVTTQEAMALMRSRQFGYAFIRNGNLSTLFFDDKWDAAERKWKVPPDEQPTESEAFNYFDRNVRTVVEDKRAGTVMLHIEWRDRAVAAQWANEFVARLNSEMQRRAIQRADASLGFLKKELEATPVVDTRNAINRLIETQVNQRMFASVSSEYAFRVVDRAVTPGKEDKVRPRKLLMAVTGGFLGFIAGLVGILLFRPVRQS